MAAAHGLAESIVFRHSRGSDNDSLLLNIRSDPSGLGTIQRFIEMSVTWLGSHHLNRLVKQVQQRCNRVHRSHFGAVSCPVQCTRSFSAKTVVCWIQSQTFYSRLTLGRVQFDLALLVLIYLFFF